MQGPNADLMENRAEMLVISNPRPNIQEPFKSLMDGLLAAVVVEVTYPFGVCHPVDNLARRVGAVQPIQAKARAAVLTRDSAGGCTAEAGRRCAPRHGKGSIQC